MNPEEIQTLLPWRNNIFRSVPGSLNVDELKEVLRAQLIAEGKKPQTFRYFISQDELIHKNDRTYAFVKRWGKRQRKHLT